VNYLCSNPAKVEGGICQESGIHENSWIAWELKVKRWGNGLDLNYCLRVSTKQITVNYACVRLCECTLLDDMSNDISIPVTHVWQQIILKRVSCKEAKKLTSPCNWTLCSQSTWRNPLHWVTTLNS
jgi:hypothetical protein